jgi:hypothetical protein
MIGAPTIIIFEQDFLMILDGRIPSSLAMKKLPSRIFAVSLSSISMKAMIRRQWFDLPTATQFNFVPGDIDITHYFISFDYTI